MKARRGTRFVAIACAVAAGALGLGVGAASAQSGPIDPAVKNVKKVKAPKTCTNIPGVTDSEIKIGTIAPLTGTASGSGFFPQIVDGEEARINAANASGELGKRKITLVKVDDKGDTAQNVAGAQQLVEQDKVFAILSQSAAGTGSAQYLNQKGVPVVGWQLGMDVYGKYPNFFGFQNANAADIKTNYTTRNGEVMSKIGAKNVALIGSNQGNSAIFIEQIADGIKRVGKGMKVVYKSTDVPVGTTEFGSYAQQIKDSGADAMYTGLDTTSNIALINALKQAGANVTHIILPAGYDPRVLGLAAFDQAYLGIEFKPLETTPAPKGIADFKAQMTQYKPDNPINQSAAVGWLSANTMIEGIKAAGVSCPTQKAFINNLRLVKNYTADGFFDPIDFQYVFNKPFQCVYYVQILNKQFVPAFDGKPVCGDLIKNSQLIAGSAPTTAPAATATTAAK
jgi:branched-chain amino acid transport system substrate-binding protein